MHSRMTTGLSENAKIAFAIPDAIRSVDSTQEKIEEYYQKGIECLNQVAVPDDRKEGLRLLAEKMLKRNR